MALCLITFCLAIVGAFSKFRLPWDPIACPEGSYADKTNGVWSCSACPEGSHAVIWAGVQKAPLFALELQQDIRQNLLRKSNSCMACSEGSYADKKGATSCVACPEGSFANQKGATSCTVCPAGSYAEKGASSCTACSAGSYADVKGAGSCVACPEGSYANQKNASSCAACSEGFYSKTGASSCIACPEGSYAHEKGARSCKACPAGKYASSPGLTQCKLCPAGTRAGAGKPECTACPRGTFGALLGQPECTACPAGKHGITKGSKNSSSCSECKDEGKYSPEAGAVHCQKCPLGQEPRVSGIRCFIPDRFKLLVKLWIFFLPVDVIILVIVGLICLQKINGQQASSDSTCAMAVLGRFFGSTWKSQLWATTVLLWDVVDYCLFAWWYLDAKPGRNQAAEFEEDFLVAKVCCGVLWVGPCLPMAALVLSRKQYSILQVIYDALELYLVYYTDYLYDFKATSALATSANYWASAVDGIVFKGPTFVYDMLCNNDSDDFLDCESPSE